MSIIRVSCSECGKGFSLQQPKADRIGRCTCGARIPIAGRSSSASDASGHVAETLHPKTPLDDPDEYEVEPLEPRTTGEPFLFDSESPLTDPKPETRKEPRTTANTKVALQIVGVWGVLIAGASVLDVVGNWLFALYLLTRPGTDPVAWVAIIALTAFNTIVGYVSYRLGVGLTNCEKDAIKGLIVIYLLLIAVAGCIAYLGSIVAAVVAAATATVVLAPPIILALQNWDDFYDPQ